MMNKCTDENRQKRSPNNKRLPNILKMDEPTQIWHIRSICSDCLFASAFKNPLPWPVRKEKLKRYSRRLTSRGLHMTSPASNIMRPGMKYTKTPYSNHVASKQGANYHLISLHHELFSRAVAEGTKDLRYPPRRHPAPPS